MSRWCPDSTRKILIFADEDPHIVADQRTWQQVCLAQDLKAVTDAQHRHPAISGLDHLGHDRGEFGDSTAPQVIPVGEPPGKITARTSSRVPLPCHNGPARHHRAGLRGARPGRQASLES